MTTRRGERRTLLGSAEIRSRLFSNEWRLVQDGREVAHLRRYGRIHVSMVELADGTDWLLEPHGWGVVRAMEDGAEEARVTRRSWFGRRWDITGVGFAYELISDPRPRRWNIAVGGAPVAQIEGSLVSYNRVRFDGMLAVPLVAVLLSWHVIARPWEAAAEPRGLVPVRSRRPDAGRQPP